MDLDSFAQVQIQLERFASSSIPDTMSNSSAPISGVVAFLLSPSMSVSIPVIGVASH